MPPVPTKPKLKDKDKSRHRDLVELECGGTNAWETEQKRSKGQMACAECKRRKIKCDKRIPCQSCHRNGCTELCPNGCLPTGQGTRFVFAATKHLHHRLAKMRERIRQLEDALSELQARHSTELHPLLQFLGTSQHDDDVGLLTAEDLEEHTPELVEALGTLSISDSGESHFFRPTGGSNCLLMVSCIQVYSVSPMTMPSRSIMYPPKTLDSNGPQLPQEIANISQVLPTEPSHLPLNAENLIKDHLPSWERARYLTKVYLEQATALSQKVSKVDILTELLPAYYANNVPHITQVGNSRHRLGLLLLIFAIGALLDPDREPGNTDAERYHQVACTTICFQSMMAKPSLEDIQLLRLHCLYNNVSGNELAGRETSTETSWSLGALAAQLAHTVSLLLFRFVHGLNWGLHDDITAKRRVVFWELFVADAWNSLDAGRPPTFSLPYIDCQFPGGGSPHDKVHIGSDQAFRESWVFRFASDCVADVAARTLTSNPPNYSTILELDHKVRDFPVTEAAIEFVAAARGDVPAKPRDEDVGSTESVTRLIMSNAREVLMLYIHLNYFVQAIIKSPTNPLQSPYAPSFQAAYQASFTILRTVKLQYDLHPRLTASLWPIWTHTFSAAFLLGTIVTRGPRSPMASSAMKELHDAGLLFSKASSRSRRAQKALPIITELREKAHHALRYAQSRMPRELSQQCGVGENEGDDDVDIFAGRMKKIVYMKRQKTDGMSERSMNSDGSARQSSTSALVLQQQQLQLLDSAWLQPLRSVAGSEQTQEVPTWDLPLYPRTSSQSALAQSPRAPLQMPTHLPYSDKQLGPTWLQQPGFATGLEPTQEVPTWDWTLYPDAASRSTLIQSSRAPLQTPHVLYSGEQLGSTWLRQPGSAASRDQTQDVPTWHRTLYPDTSSRSTLVQPSRAPLQAPHVPYNGEQSGSTRLQQPGSSTGLKQTQEVPIWDRTLYPGISPQSTLTQQVPPRGPLQILSYMQFQSSAHGGPVAGPSTGGWQPELSGPNSMTNLSTPSAQAHFQGYHPDHPRYDQYG
ncbi:hypothetical protein EDC04DRAFT_2941588 [Pisolithus marmoratus]|nr:hypothetical protein EDC04DRAFT_2941588 [Pisolithus marmoratus]